MINLLSGGCGCGSIVTAFYLLIPDTSAVEKFERFVKAFETHRCDTTGREIMTRPRCAVCEVKQASMWAHHFWMQLHKAVSYKVFLEILIFCTFECA